MSNQADVRNDTGRLRAERATRLESALRANGRALRARALWLTRNESDAADLFQDTIERSMRAKRQATDDAGALRWLLAIMHNAFLDMRRARAVRRTVADPQACLDRLSFPEDAGALPAWRTISDELLAQCIDRLSPASGAMIRLALSGAPYREIAAHFDIPMGTVAARLFRVRRQLRALLDQATRRQARPG